MANRVFKTCGHVQAVEWEQGTVVITYCRGNQQMRIALRLGVSWFTCGWVTGVPIEAAHCVS